MPGGSPRGVQAASTSNIVVGDLMIVALPQGGLENDAKGKWKSSRSVGRLFPVRPSGRWQYSLSPAFSTSSALKRSFMTVSFA